MVGPEDEFRRYVADRAGSIQTEDDLEGLLGEILERVNSDIATGIDQQPPEDLLATAEAWLGVASYALNSFYSPASLRPDFAGWSKGAVEKLRNIANTLQAALEVAARALRSAAFTVGVAFPFGASISLSWPLSPVMGGSNP
jgi:hypothetical protein